MNRFSKYLLCFVLFFSAEIFFSQNYNVDSIIKIAQASKNDSVKFSEYRRALQLYQTKGNTHKADSVLKVLFFISNNGTYAHAKAYYLTEEARSFEMKGRYPEAIDLLFQALKISEEKKLVELSSAIYNSLGMIHFTLEDYDKALEYYTKAVDLMLSNKKEKGLSNFYNNIGNVFYAKKNYSKAIDFYNRALEISIKKGMTAKAANFLNNIGSLYIELKDYDKAMNNFLQAQKIFEVNEDKYNLAYTFLNEGTVHIRKNNLSEAKKRLSEALKIAQELQYTDVLRDGHFAFSELYLKLKDAPKSIENYKLYVLYKDSLNNKDQIKKITQKEMTYEFSKKELIMQTEREKQSIQMTEERKRNKLVLFFILFGTLTVIVFTGIIYTRYKLTDKQRIIIEEKNKDVMDSINYARRLQNAILIPEQELSKHFSQAFILYKPKDIVSGDFYWFAETPLNKIIAVADCTGHGVPGGFMSMLGYESLQDVALRENVSTPAEALKSLDKKITHALNKSEKSFRDGMDIVLCAFSKSENMLQFSGANRSLVQISEGELIEHKPNKNTIGGDIDNTDKQYTVKNISCKKGDLFYMFTDGYADQFGGPDGRKFMTRKLKELLLSISPLNMSEQKVKMEQAFDQWKEGHEQIDDVCVIGIQI